MAAEASNSNPSGDSYIGSFITLTSKSDIRYEGFVFHIDAKESTIGLRNVRSFGTEGRKVDGPQVPPADKVYEYIYFRGSDLKDLTVISSPPALSTEVIHSDPAIIQTHFPHHSSSPTILQAASIASVANLTSSGQLGSTGSTFQGSLPVFQPAGNLGSWGLIAPQNAHVNGHPGPMFWPGLSGSAGGLPHVQQQTWVSSGSGLMGSLQQQLPHSPAPPLQHQRLHSVTSLVQQTPSDLVASSMQQQNQSNHNDVSLNIASNDSAFSRPLQTCRPVNLASLLHPTHSSPSTNHAGHTTAIVNQMTNIASLPSPIARPVSGKPSESIVKSSSLELNVVPPVTGKPKSMHVPRMPCESISESETSGSGTSSAHLTEVSPPSLVTPHQFLQSTPATISSSHSVQTTDKDIEVIQASTSKLSLLDSINKKKSVSELPSLPVKKVTRDAFHAYHGSSSNVRGRGSEIRRDGLHRHSGGDFHAWSKGNEVHRGASHVYYASRGHGRGRGTVPNGAGLRTHHRRRGRERERGNGLDRTVVSTHYNYKNHAIGNRCLTSQPVAKFAEDFDFEAMNEKFNKDEVWSDLGRSHDAKVDYKADHRKDFFGGDTENYIEDKLPNGESKTVYVKDDFFDTLTCETLDLNSADRRAKFQEQLKIDTETFGDFRRHRGGGRGRSWGSYNGRKYGYVAKGRGTQYRV